MAASRYLWATTYRASASTRLCFSRQARATFRLQTRGVATSQDEATELPNGFLFNEKPLLPGEKRQKESWENVWIWGMFGNLVLAGIVYWFKPDTYPSTLARKEAERRLAEKEGTVVEEKL